MPQYQQSRLLYLLMNGLTAIWCQSSASLLSENRHVTNHSNHYTQLSIPIVASFLEVASHHCCLSSSMLLQLLLGQLKSLLSTLILVFDRWNSAHRPVTSWWVLLMFSVDTSIQEIDSKCFDRYLFHRELVIDGYLYSGTYPSKVDTIGTTAVCPGGNL